MFDQAHKSTREMTVGGRKFVMVVEVSATTSGIFEGTLYEDGKEVRRITVTAGVTEQDLKRTLLREVHSRCGKQFDDSGPLGTWAYQKLNLDGTAAGN